MGENIAAFSSPSTILQFAGSELEHLLKRVDRVTNPGGVGERPEQLAAFEAGLAGDINAGKVVGGRDLKVWKGLVAREVARYTAAGCP
jgi:hypothetical protein